jgi:hypothetical protein
MEGILIRSNWTQWESWAREEIHLMMDLLSQLIQGIDSFKKSLGRLPDDQHLRLSLMPAPPALEQEKKWAQLLYFKEIKSRVGFLLYC